jgi:hypothetical protein
MSSERLMIIPLTGVCLLVICFNMLFDAVLFKQVHDLHSRNSSFYSLRQDFVMKKSPFKNGTWPTTPVTQGSRIISSYISLQEEEDEKKHLKKLQENFDKKKKLLRKQRQKQYKVQRKDSFNTTV